MLVCGGVSNIWTRQRDVSKMLPFSSAVSLEIGTRWQEKDQAPPRSIGESLVVMGLHAILIELPIIALRVLHQGRLAMPRELIRILHVGVPGIKLRIDAHLGTVRCRIGNPKQKVLLLPLSFKDAVEEFIAKA